MQTLSYQTPRRLPHMHAEVCKQFRPLAYVLNLRLLTGCMSVVMQAANEATRW